MSDHQPTASTTEWPPDKASICPELKSGMENCRSLRTSVVPKISVKFIANRTLSAETLTHVQKLPALQGHCPSLQALLGVIGLLRCPP